MNPARTASGGAPASSRHGGSDPSTLPDVAPGNLVPASSRAVVVAPHPDDEVLGAGGLLAQLAHLGRDILLIAVTDGSASHPDSTRWTPERLAATRPRETAHALRILGVKRARIVRGTFPDGAVAEHENGLIDYLLSHLDGNDVVLSTWRRDGHPDHESVGRASARAARIKNARLVEFPIWMWHRETTESSRTPWSGAHGIALDSATLRLKRLAISAYASQLESDPSTGREPVLTPAVLARLVRSHEVVFL